MSQNKKKSIFAGLCLIAMVAQQAFLLSVEAQGQTPTSTKFSEQRFEETGPLPVVDEPAAYPVSPPASATTHPFLNQGEHQFQHHRDLVPVVPMQKLSTGTVSSPVSVPQQNFHDGGDVRAQALGNFLGGVPTIYNNSANPVTSPTAGTMLAAPSSTSPYANSNSYGKFTGFYSNAPATNSVSSNPNDRYIYSFYRRSEREARRAYAAARRANHETVHEDRLRAASEAHYAARTAQYSYDRVYKAAKNGDPLAKQFVDRARNNALRARDDAARAQEDANRPDPQSDSNHQD